MMDSPEPAEPLWEAEGWTEWKLPGLYSDGCAMLRVGASREDRAQIPACRDAQRCLSTSADSDEGRREQPWPALLRIKTDEAMLPPLSHLYPGLRQVGYLLRGHGHRRGVGVDSDGLPAGPDAFGQQSQDGARTAAHIGDPGTRRNARSRPLRRLVIGRSQGWLDRPRRDSICPLPGVCRGGRAASSVHSEFREISRSSRAIFCACSAGRAFSSAFSARGSAFCSRSCAFAPCSAATTSGASGVSGTAVLHHAGSQ
jgi:hypothetical protein